MTSHLTREILADLEVPRDVQISKDGKLVTYITQSTTRKDHGSPETFIWLAEVGKAGSAARITDGGYLDVSPAFSPDGASIAFLSNRVDGKNNDLYMIFVENTDDALKLTESSANGTIEAFKWSSDGKFIVVNACLSKDVDIKVYGESFAYRNLWALDTLDKHIFRLTTKSADVVDFDLNANENEVAFCTQADPELDSADQGQEVKTVKVSRDQQGHERHVSHVPNRLHNLCWSEKGILGVASYNWKGTSDGKALHILSEEGHQRFRYGEHNDPRGGLKTCWGRTVVGVQEGLYDSLRDIEDNVLHSDRESITSYDATFEKGSTTLTVIKDSVGKPAEVYSIVDGQMCQLSKHGQNIADMHIGKAHFVEYDNDGVQMDGYYCMQTALRAEFGQKPLPTAVIAHGGPYTRCTDGFDAPMSASLVPYLMSKGYLVLIPNYRGGSSHGHKYAYAVDGNADVSYEDVVWLVKKGVEEGRIDKDRVALGGFSQGGYITYLAVTRPSTFHFAAAMAGAGVSDWYLDTCVTDLHTYMATLMGYAPWDKAVPTEKMRRSSPIHCAEDVETPLLIIHGEEDTRVPVQNATLFQRALKAYGKEFEMALYPRHTHGSTPMVWERAHFLDMLARTEKFFAKHVLR